MPGPARRAPGTFNERFSLKKADGTPIGPPWGFVIEEDDDPTPNSPPLGPTLAPSVAMPVHENDQAWIDQASDEARYSAALARFQSLIPSDGVLDDARWGPHVPLHHLTTTMRYFLSNFLDPIRRGQVCEAWYNVSARRVPRTAGWSLASLMPNLGTS